MTVVNRDGVFLGDGRAWTAWSRRADAQWLADQAGGLVGGLGAAAAPAPSTDLYRWPGHVVVVAGPDVSTDRGTPDVHAGPSADVDRLAGGAGPSCCRPGVDEPAHTAGPSRPVPLFWREVGARWWLAPRESL